MKGKLLHNSNCCRGKYSYIERGAFLNLFTACYKCFMDIGNLF